jgi:hypothetical protein
MLLPGHPPHACCIVRDNCWACRVPWCLVLTMLVLPLPLLLLLLPRCCCCCRCCYAVTCTNQSMLLTLLPPLLLLLPLLPSHPPQACCVSSWCPLSMRGGLLPITMPNHPTQPLGCCTAAATTSAAAAAAAAALPSHTHPRHAAATATAAAQLPTPSMLRQFVVSVEPAGWLAAWVGGVRHLMQVHQL